LEQARGLLDQHGSATALALIGCLVQVLRKEWPDCRSLSGALQKYMGDALNRYQAQQRREAGKKGAEQRRQQERQEQQNHQSEDQQLSDRWNALAAPQQLAIRQTVLARLGGGPAPEAFIHRLCLQEMRQSEETK
jgi:hypothetical protein